ncbi:hypothetical protein M9H77_02300 [Catharanthus roseus]|uniref:Uncharacterized protein n=1 Tax=Catharanthus roseus TaxID=4058 RepID=A0ACC0C8I5_CATRO|nr:hypothetical protein M9H77_02300 [Catharanthus roseus]
MLRTWRESLTHLVVDCLRSRGPPVTSCIYLVVCSSLTRAEIMSLGICGQASRADAKELSGCWSLLEAWIYLYFPMFAPPVGARLCKPYIQRSDGLRTDLMRLLIYGFLPHPIRPQEHRRLANNRVYMVKNVFIESLWLEAPSHLLTSTWTSIHAIPSSRCTDNYMLWFLPRTHPRIQNPDRLPRGMQLPTIAPITPQVLLDMVARELDHDDIDDATKVSRASDMIKRYHQTRR